MQHLMPDCACAVQSLAAGADLTPKAVSLMPAWDALPLPSTGLFTAVSSTTHACAASVQDPGKQQPEGAVLALVSVHGATALAWLLLPAHWLVRHFEAHAGQVSDAATGLPAG